MVGMPNAEFRPSAASITEFCHFARENGLSNGVQQTLAALEVAKAIELSGPEVFAPALRAVLTSSKEEWDLFDHIFELFRSASQNALGPDSKEDKVPRFSTHKPAASSRALMGLSGSDASQAEREGKAVSGASAQQRLQKVDLADVPQDDLLALQQISMRLFRRMSQRLSRRRKIRNLAERIDVRRTIRRSISRGGDPIVLAFRGRKPHKHRLVIFLDISGSMNSYSLFLVRFAYALQKYFKRVNTFLFSTNVVEITDLLRTRDLPDALRGLSQRAAGWAGGTRIGDSLRDFNLRHGRQLLSSNTAFLILSDGWDTGEPERLAGELRNIRRRVHEIIWLNPLLGLEEYAPVTRCMSAALPHVDVFAPAHSLQSLLALEKYL
jgi:uncharacterized protein with von Willebrand factor type A (vWA) domain